MIMDERYIAAVDLGTSKIAVTVAQIDDQDVQMLYYKETPAEGMRNSWVLNPSKVAAPLKKAINEAETELGIKIRQAVVNLPRYEVKQETATANLTRTDVDSSISIEEINYLKNNAIDSYPLSDPAKEVMFGVIAQSFSADDCFNHPESEIEGMFSDTLGGTFKVFIGRKRYSDNVDRVMNLVNVALAKKYFLPDVTAKAVLTKDERQSGVALIEFGAGATSVSIYKGDIMRYYSSIPFGGRTITNDIKFECSISEALAENIKLAYGVCNPDKLLTLRDKIIQINNDELGTRKQLSVKYLSEIITCRLKEIVDACLYKIQESGVTDMDLACGIVITGGGANIPNLASFIKDNSGFNVRLGYPIHKFSYSGCNEINQLSATASVGMVLAAKENNWINCLSEAPVRKTATPASAPVEETIEAAAAAQEEMLEQEEGQYAETEEVEVEETAPVGQGWIQDVPDPEPVDESYEEEPVEEEEEIVEEPAEEEVVEEVVEEPKKEERREKKEKKEKVKKESRFKISWSKPFERVVQKVGGIVDSAINNGYDGMTD